MSPRVWEQPRGRSPQLIVSQNPQNNQKETVKEHSEKEECLEEFVTEDIQDQEGSVVPGRAFQGTIYQTQMLTVAIPSSQMRKGLPRREVTDQSLRALQATTMSQRLTESQQSYPVPLAPITIQCRLCLCPIPRPLCSSLAHL